MDAQRIKFLNVPIDIVNPEDLPNVISGFLAAAKSPPPRATVLRGLDDRQPVKGQNIVLLSLSDLLRARRSGEYRNYVCNAALVIPISKCIVSGARFLTGKQVFRYMPFKFVINLLSILERQEHSLYLLGSKSRMLRKAEKNIHATFPRLNIVGRHEGGMRKKEESDVIQAIRKSSAALLLVGKGGIRGKELWIARNSRKINSGMRLWCSDLFDVFAERKHRPSDTVFNMGLEGLGLCFRNPLRFFRFFSYVRYKLLLLFYKIFVR